MSGYCSIEDVEWVLQQADITTMWDTATVTAAIEAQSEWVELNTRRHWFESGGADNDEHDVIFTSNKSRDDEHDLPTHGGFVHGASQEAFRSRKNSDALLEAGPGHRGRRKQRRRQRQEIRIATGDVQPFDRPVDSDVPAYTRIRPERKDVTAINSLEVMQDDGTLVDWVASSDFDGGIGRSNIGEDFWLRENNRGVCELYLDVRSMDKDIASLSNAVYIDIDYGLDGIPAGVRRGVASLAAAQLVIDDEAAIGIEDAGQLMAVETKGDRLERWAIGTEYSHLQPHLESSW